MSIYNIATILTFLAINGLSLGAQTLSNCRANTPFNEKAKPSVVGLALSRDGKTLLVAGGDAKVHILDIASGNVQRALMGHKNSLYKAIYSPDERLIATSSRDHTARLWNASSGELLRTLDGFRCAVKAVSFSPDGNMIGASGNDGMLKLWDVKTGRELKTFVHINSADIDMSTYSFVFTADGKHIFAANGDGTISEWDIGSGREINNWKALEPSQIWMAQSQDKKQFATISRSTVKIWDIRTHQELRAFELPRTPGDSPLGTSVAFSHDGKLLAAGDSGFDSKGTAYLYIQTVVWNVKTGKQLFVLKGQKFDVDALQFTRDDRSLITGSVDGTIDFWDMRTGKLEREIKISK